MINPSIKMTCIYCGGPNVMRDAWAVWNIDTQKWELGNVFDHAECADCESETQINESPVEEDAA